jgi:hypothetical protein
MFITIAGTRYNSRYIMTITTSDVGGFKVIFTFDAATAVAPITVNYTTADARSAVLGQLDRELDAYPVPAP